MNEIHHLPFVGDYTGWQGTLTAFVFMFFWMGGRIEKQLDRIIELMRRREFREKTGRWPD